MDRKTLKVVRVSRVHLILVYLAGASANFVVWLNHEPGWVANVWLGCAILFVANIIPVFLTEDGGTLG